jgi:hypothetical protein
MDTLPIAGVLEVGFEPYLLMFHSLIENPPFLTKSLQLHDICNCVFTDFFLIFK